MRKYRVLIISLFICGLCLMGCSNDENQDNSIPDSELDSTSDPMEIATNDSYNILKDGMTELEIIGKYISDRSDEDGMVTLEENGYSVKFALILVYNPVVDENQLYVIGERENTNTSGGMMGIPESEIKTRESGKLEDGFTTGGIKPDSKDTFTNIIFMNDAEKPLEAFTISFKKPIDEDDLSENTNQEKVWKSMEFYRE